MTELVESYLDDDIQNPLFLVGDSLEVLKKIPSNSIDCIITSPPYWGQREYENGGIGLEKNYKEFIENFLEISEQLYRVLKKGGSFWLNVGDTYSNKSLLGIPWRIAIAMIDDQNWILRNSIIWNKQKGGMDSSKDRLRNIHENFFHFVINKKYHYDDKSIRSKPRKAIKKNGSLISATGVSGVRYKRQIELSTSLTDDEKVDALTNLAGVIDRIQEGTLSDFRMIIRNQQRTTHSNSTKVSGRAKELRDKGFYFLFYNQHGTLPTDVWEIIPEDSQKRKKHFAPFPQDLCKLPILATCPLGGIVLDPFCGTGTANKVAFESAIHTLDSNHS
jgi:site-specific DNA-methyltransferase (adenine-specific)